VPARDGKAEASEPEAHEITSLFRYTTLEIARAANQASSKKPVEQAEMTKIEKDSSVKLKDAALAGWPELQNRVGVVKDVAQNGSRVQVSSMESGWLGFAPEDLEVQTVSPADPPT